MGENLLTGEVDLTGEACFDLLLLALDFSFCFLELQVPLFR